MNLTNEFVIQEAEYCPSPHQDLRPDEQDISLLVLHNISLPPNQYNNDYVKSFFLGQLDPQAHPYFSDIATLRVSAHLFIKRNGDLLQFVPFSKRAWHAGMSVFQGRHKCNDYSIGIEIEGNDEQPYTDAQYTTLNNVTCLITKAYPKISLGRIVGHNDIAPGRKTDPGYSFDWCRFRSHYVASQLTTD